MSLSRNTVQERLRRIRLLSLDVDGTLTDAGVYYGTDGTQFRKFNIRDGMGIVKAREAGLVVAIVTASKTADIRLRAEALKLEHVFLDAQDKVAVLSALCASLGIGLAEAAHMGDDINDLTLFETAGLALAPLDALPEVAARADWISAYPGGCGAVREACDLWRAVHTK